MLPNIGSTRTKARQWTNETNALLTANLRISATRHSYPTSAIRSILRTQRQTGLPGGVTEQLPSPCRLTASGSSIVAVVVNIIAFVPHSVDTAKTAIVEIDIALLDP